MYASACESRSISPAARIRLIVVSLLIAGTILLSSWLRTVGAAPGAALLALVGAGLYGGWLLERYAPIRGLPLTAAGIFAAVAGLQWTLGLPLDAIPPGGSLFVALMLTLFARSWSVGLTATLVLAGAELLAALI